jgi:hypothetical protein
MPAAVGRRTVGRAMSRTVFGLLLGGVIVIAVALAVAWRSELTEQAFIDRVVKPAAVATPAPAPAAETSQVPPMVPPPAPPAAAAKPSFDIARVGPDGRAVVAGRAAPGAKVLLLDGGKEIASSTADANGEWVVVTQDTPLGPGQHELRVIEHIDGRAPVTSDQVVVVVVPDPPVAGAASKEPLAVAGAPPRDQTLVMITPPAGPTTLVQPPTSAGVPKSGDLVLSTLDYDDRGHVTVTGQATPGTAVRVYVDDKAVAEGVAGADGRWRLTPSEPLAHGKHKLRLDRLAKDGKPVGRLELPFERAVVPPGTAGDGRRLYVVRGDNLWNIARAHYGQGWHHTKIYNANKDQIRDPDLIYPGQVFSLPKAN